MMDPAPAAYVVGTAGHIDHGKSTLVKALTGIDPDRLEEEKRRGMTIDLGFAYFDLPSGRHVGIVDVNQGRDLELSILDTNALLLVREGNDLAVAAVGDEGGASRAGSVLVEKARQHVHRDVGR